MIDNDLATGRAALQAGRWQEARAAFEACLERDQPPEALDGIAEALWWLCEARSSVRYRERAFVRYREEGDVRAAFMAAVNLSIAYLVNLGNEVAAKGWLARAERLIDGSMPDPMEGWVWLMRGFLSSEPEVEHSCLIRALGWARESDDTDLELIALGDLGLALVVGGDREQGLALLDEAMAGALGGERKRLDTVVYTSCNMLAACNLVGDLARASQWCRVADDFMHQYSCPFLFARCRVHYGSVLVAKGHWSSAEEALRAALGMSEDAGPGPQAEALSRLADLRLRQGRLEEAEALLTDLDEPATVSLPAAAIRLARGDLPVAVALLERRVKQVAHHYFELVPTLAMLVDAYLAEGDLGAARGAASQLDEAVLAHGDDHAAALTSLARAHISIADRRLDAAIEHLERALQHFSSVDLPLESARVRLELAAALAERSPEVAVTEAKTALSTFERLGAKTDADAAAAQLRSLGARRSSGARPSGVLTNREREVLGLVGLGLSNPEIAQRLFISRKTAAHHVSNVLAKLGLRNRAEAVAYAARSQERHVSG